MKVRRYRELVVTAGGQVTEWKRLPYLSPFKLREKYSWSTCLLSHRFCLNQRHLLQIKDVFLFWKKSVKSQPQRHERSAGSTLDRELKRRMQGVEGYREAEWLGMTERRRRLKIKKKNDADNIILGESEGNSYFLPFCSLLSRRAPYSSSPSQLNSVVENFCVRYQVDHNFFFTALIFSNLKCFG